MSKMSFRDLERQSNAHGFVRVHRVSATRIKVSGSGFCPGTLHRDTALPWNGLRNGYRRLSASAEVDFFFAPDRRCPNFSSPAHMKGEASGRVIETLGDLFVHAPDVGSKLAS